MRGVLVVALLAACGNEPSEGFPINPGGPGGTGSSFMPDAFVPLDVSTTITGRVCLMLTDLQKLATCAPSGAGGFLVTLGTESTASADDGTFTIKRPTATNGLVWSVTSTTTTSVETKPSVIPFGTTTTLPALALSEYEDMVVATNATVVIGSGALMVRITHAGGPVLNATVTTMPVPDSAAGIFYDGPNDTSWQTTATGAFGVAWVPSITTGNASVTVHSGAVDTTFTGQPVFDGAVTFVFADLP